MPATAARQPDEGDPRLASVVPLAERRSLKKAVTGPAVSTDLTNAELQEKALQHWTRVFHAAGVNLGAPESAAVIAVVVKELERLVGGLQILREGREGTLPPNPNAGLDLTSAVEMTGLLRDLGDAAETARAERG
jgi:hypothetical protein